MYLFIHSKPFGTHGANLARQPHIDITLVEDKHGIPATAVKIASTSRFGYYKLESQIDSWTIDFTLAFHVMIFDDRFMYMMEFSTEPDREQIVLYDRKLVLR